MADSALKRIAAKVDAMLKFAVDTRVEAGLLSEDEAKAWRANYQHYVPLRGEAELDPELSADRPRSGSGVNVRGARNRRWPLAGPAGPRTGLFGD
jgi:hypothetical protein